MVLVEISLATDQPLVIVLPQDLAKSFPQQLKDLLQWHINTNGDHLVSGAGCCS
jgi:hypothetical protein